MNKDHLKDYIGEDEIITSHELKAELDKVVDDTPRVKTGFTMLDDWTLGFKGGDLITVSGISGEGKTSFCQTLTYRMAELDNKILWFTYEIAPKYFMEKFPELPVFTLPRKLKSGNLDWIEEKIMESKVKYGTKIVFIDHAHYLINTRNIDKISAEMGCVARELKQLAIEHNMIIFLIAHLRKVPEDRTPEGVDIRDSGMILCESDHAIIVWRVKGKKKLVDDKGYPYNKEQYANADTDDVIHTNLGKLYLCKTRETGKKGYIMLEMRSNLFWEYV